MKWILLPIIALQLAACGSNAVFIRGSASDYAPFGKPDDVLVLFESPATPHEVLGIIEWDYWRPGLRSPTLSDALPVLKKKAWAKGAAAIIIRNRRLDVWNTRILHITAEVIRFLPRKKPKREEEPPAIGPPKARFL